MSISGMIYNELKARIEHLPKQYKKYKPAWDALDREEVIDIILDGEIFWFECNMYNNFTNRQHDLLVEYIESKGYKFLHNLQREADRALS